MKSPVETAIDAVVRCVKCNAKYGECGCWDEKESVTLYMKDKNTDESITLYMKDKIFLEFRNCLKRNGIRVTRNDSAIYDEFLGFLNSITINWALSSRCREVKEQAIGYLRRNYEA